MMKTTLKVDGMSCAHCENSVKTALGALGVSATTVSLENKTVEVEYDENKLNIEAIKSEIEDQGFEVC